MKPSAGKGLGLIWSEIGCLAGNMYSSEIVTKTTHIFGCKWGWNWVYIWG